MATRKPGHKPSVIQNLSPRMGNYTHSDSKHATKNTVECKTDKKTSKEILLLVIKEIYKTA